MIFNLTNGVLWCIIKYSVLDSLMEKRRWPGNHAKRI